MANGLVATIAWGLVLTVYCVFRAFGIEDPLIGQAFLLLTGAWVGNLTLAQGKKAQRVEEIAVNNQAKIDKLAEVAKAEHPEIAKDL